MKMHRQDKIQPLNSKFLEDKFFRRNYKDDKKDVEDVSITKKILQAIFASTIHQTLEEAEDHHNDICTQREKEMESIALHQYCSVSWWYLLWALVGPAIGIAAVFIGFVLWPTENVFLHPDHWYECMLQCGVVWIGMC